MLLGELPPDYTLVVSNGLPYLAFAEDVSQVAFVAKGKNGPVLIANGRQTDPYLGLRYPVFSGTGAVLFDTVEKNPGGKIAYLVNMTLTEFFDKKRTDDLSTLPDIDTIQPHFSPDGKHVAVKIIKGNSEAVLLDGKAGTWYDKVVSPSFNPRTSNVAFFAKRGVQWLMIDGVDQRKLDYEPSYLQFDYQGKPIILGRPIVGGNTSYDKEFADFGESGRGPLYKSVGPLVTNPVGPGFAYVAEDSEGRKYVLHGDRRDGPYGGFVFPLRFTEDGKHLFYAVISHEESRFIFDDHSYRERGLISGLVANANGFAYATVTEKQARIVLNGREVASFTGDGPIPSADSIALSSDALKVAYVVEYPKKGMQVRCDEFASPFYARINGLQFRNNGSDLVFGAAKGRKFVKVTVTLT